MSILINLCSSVQDEGCPAEYVADGHDARRIAAVAGHPGAEKVVTAIVTFFHEDLTPYGDFERFKESRDDSGTADLFRLEDLQTPRSEMD